MDRHFKPSFLYRKCHQPNWWLWHWQQCFFWWCNWRTNMCTCRCRLVILDDHFWEKLIVEKTWKNKNGKTNCFTKYHPKRVAGQIQPQKCIFESRTPFKIVPKKREENLTKVNANNNEIDLNKWWKSMVTYWNRLDNYLKRTKKILK